MMLQRIDNANYAWDPDKLEYVEEPNTELIEVNGWPVFILEKNERFEFTCAWTGLMITGIFTSHRICKEIGTRLIESGNISRDNWLTDKLDKGFISPAYKLTGYE